MERFVQLPCSKYLLINVTNDKINLNLEGKNLAWNLPWKIYDTQQTENKIHGNLPLFGH